MRSLLTLCILATFLTGCATLDEKKRQQLLEDTIRQYEHAIRWGDFASAAGFQRLEQKVTQQAITADAIRVTSYRQLKSHLVAEGDQVSITVKIDYYMNDTLKVKTLTDNQVWKFYPEETAWFITTPLPDFR